MTVADHELTLAVLELFDMHVFYLHMQKCVQACVHGHL